MNKITLEKAVLDDDYRKKWNEILTDFVCIFKNGKKVSDTLYRTGAMGGKVDNKYFLMLKYVESVYDKSITDDKDKRLHLESHWCIIDNNGVEKAIFSQFASPYLCGGIIYVLNNNYYNIETGELIAHSYNSLDSDNYIFLDNHFDIDKSKRGVIKIKKSDGSIELFQ